MKQRIKNSALLLALTLLLSACGGQTPSSSPSPTSSDSGVAPSSGETTSSGEASSSEDSSSSEEDPYAFTSRNIARVLRGMEEVALKGSMTYIYQLSGFDEIERYSYETEGYWSSDLVYMRSQEVDGGNLGLDVMKMYPTETGGIASEYLDRDNTVKIATTEETKFVDNYKQPFSTFPIIAISPNEENYVATIYTDQRYTYFIDLMWLTINMGFGDFYEPDYVQISFDEDLNPYRIYAYGAYSGFGTSIVRYYGEFVKKEDLHDMEITIFAHQEGQEPLGEMLKALQDADKYSASITKTKNSDGTVTNASLIVDEAKGVVETSSEGIVGTYAGENGYYTISGGEGSAATATSALLEGDAFKAYFSDTYYGDIAPDFVYSEDQFIVNADGSFTLDAPYTYMQIEYLLPDNAWNTMTANQHVYPTCTFIDKGSLTISGSITEGIKISYTAYTKEYSVEILISDLGTAVYPYTSITPLAE